MTILRRVILAVIVILSVAPAAFSQTQAERVAWMKEMNRFKHEFLARELKLTAQQQKQFFALYDAMDTEIRKINDNTRKLEKTVKDKGDKATDLEREKAAEAMFELKGRENEIEMRYFPKFKEVLTPTQLFELKHAERRFNRELIKEHKKHRQSAEKACKKK